VSFFFLQTVPDTGLPVFVKLEGVIFLIHPPVLLGSTWDETETRFMPKDCELFAFSLKFRLKGTGHVPRYRGLSRMILGLFLVNFFPSLKEYSRSVSSFPLSDSDSDELFSEGLYSEPESKISGSNLGIKVDLLDCAWTLEFCSNCEIFICLYVYMFICLYVYMFICLYVYMFICLYVYMFICLYVLSLQIDLVVAWSPDAKAERRKYGFIFLQTWHDTFALKFLSRAARPVFFVHRTILKNSR
jgi:hypothetical protein